MSKSIKLSDNIYIDSSGITYNRELLNSVLNSISSSITSINSNINDINIEIDKLKEVTTGTLEFTKTSGNSTVNGSYVKYGNVVSVNVSITTTGATASGSNVWVGQINNIVPAINTILIGYSGARTILGAYTTAKNLTIRNASSSSLPKDATFSIRGTFII